MPEFIHPVFPGDDIEDNFTAEAFNAFAAATNITLGGIVDQRGNTLSYEDNPNVFPIVNGSGAAREAYDVLAISGIIFTPTANLTSFQKKPVISCTLPTLANSGKFGILLQPVGTSDNTKCGRAAICGTWVVKLNVVHEQHPYADIANNSARLTSNWYGGAKILYKESGTGEKWAMVRLCEQFRGPIEGKVSAPSGIAAGATGSVTVWPSGAVSSPAHSVQAEFAWMATGTLPFNAQCLVWWVPDQQKYKIYNSSCPVQS